MQEARVPMDDATYKLVLIDGTWYISENFEDSIEVDKVERILPTYTLPQILFKLSEWHEEYKSLSFIKDAPFYAWYYDKASNRSPFNCVAETPIESAARLLINCVKEGYDCVKSIIEKYERQT